MVLSEDELTTIIDACYEAQTVDGVFSMERDPTLRQITDKLKQTLAEFQNIKANPGSFTI